MYEKKSQLITAPETWGRFRMKNQFHLEKCLSRRKEENIDKGRLFKSLPAKNKNDRDYYIIL